MPTTDATASVLHDPARTLALHAIRASIDDRLDSVRHELLEHYEGRNRTGLVDARDLLTGVIHLVDALEQLGPPGDIGEVYAG